MFNIDLITRNKLVTTKTVISVLLLLLLCLTQNTFANTFEEGKQAYLKKDYSRAIEILKPLAENGNAKAQITMGIMYDYGHGVPKDSAESIKWYRMAAEQGEPLVQLDLGIKYFQGQGVAQNYQEAGKWWEMSANAGVADSQFNLGLMYYRGIGFEKDFDKASSLFEQAAEQGHANAQYSLAVMYAFGQNRQKNYTTALNWFRKAAAQGVAQAEFNLGVFYENGYGVEQDLAKAHAWFVLAANQDLQEAIEKLRAFDKTAILKKTNPEKETNQFTAQTTSSIPISQLDMSQLLSQQPADNYTLQLISVTSEEVIIKYINDSKLGEAAGYVKVVVEGTTRYAAIYGIYQTYEAAKTALNVLPESIRKTKPWVRNIGILQGLLL